MRVGKLAEDGVVASRFEILHGPSEDRIEQRSSVPDIKIERHQMAPEMKLRIIV
jgi:hypothetical protein